MFKTLIASYICTARPEVFSLNSSICADSFHWGLVALVCIDIQECT